MQPNRILTAIIGKEGDGFVALCPELDVASQVVMQRRLAETTITVPVPMQREIRKGTLRAIIRQSQLPRFHFE